MSILSENANEPFQQRVFSLMLQTFEFASTTVPSFVVVFAVLYGIRESIHAPINAKERYTEKISSSE